MASGHPLFSALQQRCLIQPAKTFKTKHWYRLQPHLRLRALRFILCFSSSQHNIPSSAVLLNKGLSFRVKSHCAAPVFTCVDAVCPPSNRKDTLPIWIFRPWLHKYFRMQDSYLRRQATPTPVTLQHCDPVSQALAHSLSLACFHCLLFQFGE